MFKWLFPRKKPVPPIPVQCDHLLNWDERRWLLHGAIPMHHKTCHDCGHVQTGEVTALVEGWQGRTKVRNGVALTRNSHAS